MTICREGVSPTGKHTPAALLRRALVCCLPTESNVLAAVIEYLRRESGSLLRSGSNMIHLSAVCLSWRRINRTCAEEWLAGSHRPTNFDWSIPNFATYLRGAVHNTNLLDSPQFLRGSENFRLAVGFMDGQQMNSDGAWLPVSDCPRAIEPPSHLCVSLTIADKDIHIAGTTGEMEVTFTLHHRDPKQSRARSMRRTFCWGTSGSEVRRHTHV